MGRKPSLQLIIALMGFRIHPSKKLPSPRDNDSTNGRIDSQADGQNPSGQRPSSEIHVSPMLTEQACSIGFSYSAIKSVYTVCRTAVIFTRVILFAYFSFLIGSSADGFATAGCLSGNTRFGISPSHFVGSSFLIPISLCGRGR